ncbi:type IV toxin-antitoxin system AbiEi family antitoxin domain-containing protein [Klebsiella pneumoniae]|nr:type IV toxin-antitoxin system AbiEi family antitoxin domain-containing protein [Klebsiella pneumoniae]
MRWELAAYEVAEKARLPGTLSFNHALQKLFQGLVNLNPRKSRVSSFRQPVRVQAKRLYLFFASFLRAWRLKLKRIDSQKIDLGAGRRRQIVENGKVQ